jgi:hypothetical protein
MVRNPIVDLKYSVSKKTALWRYWWRKVWSLVAFPGILHGARRSFADGPDVRRRDNWVDGMDFLYGFPPLTKARMWTTWDHSRIFRGPRRFRLSVGLTADLLLALFDEVMNMHIPQLLRINRCTTGEREMV